MSEYNCDDCELDCSTVVKALCREALIDDCKALQAENKRLREALKGLLLSYNKHWIRLPLESCRDMTPSKIAQTVVDAEKALKG